MSHRKDAAIVAAFLAMAVKEKLVLNSYSAQETFEAYTRVIGVPRNQQAELLCKMLGDEPTA